MPVKTRPVTYRMPEEAIEAMRRVAMRTDYTVSEIVRESLRLFLAGHGEIVNMGVERGNPKWLNRD